MGNKVYVIYNEAKERVGLKIDADTYLTTDFNGDMKQVIRAAAGKYANVLNTGEYVSIYAYDLIKEEEKIKEPVAEPVAIIEEPDSEVELEEDLIPASEEEENLINTKLEEEGIEDVKVENVKKSNKIKNWIVGAVAGATIALVAFTAGFSISKNNNDNKNQPSYSNSMNNGEKEQEEIKEIFTKTGIDAANELTAASMNIDGKYQTFTAKEWLTSYFEQNAGLFSDVEWVEILNGYDGIIKNYDTNHMSLNQKRINYFAFTKSKNAIDPFLNLFESNQDKALVQEVWNAYFKAISPTATEADIEEYNKKVLESFGLSTNETGHADGSNDEHYGSKELVAAIASAGGLNGISTQETMDLVYGNNTDIKGYYSTICSLNKSQRELILRTLKDDNTKLEILASNIKTPRQLTEEDYMKEYEKRVNEQLVKLEEQYSFGGIYTENSGTYKEQTNGYNFTSEEKQEAQARANDDFNDQYAEANRILAAKGEGANALNTFWSSNSGALIMGTMPISSLEVEASNLITTYGSNHTLPYVTNYTAGVNEAKGEILGAIARGRAEYEAGKEKSEPQTQETITEIETQEAITETQGVPTGNNIGTQEIVTVTEERYDNNGNLISSVTTNSSIPKTQAYDATVYGLDIPDEYYENQNSGVNR